MKNNKLLSIVLALLVCLTMVVSVAATSEADLAFTLESSDSGVEALDAVVSKAGDTFTVTVSLEKNPGVLAAVGYIKYDVRKLELVSAKAVAENVTVPDSTVTGRVSVVVGNTNATFKPEEYKAFTATGAVAELTFKVLEETDVTTSIALTVNQLNVVDAKGTVGTVTVEGDELNVHVVAGDHDCSKYETIEANKVDPTCTEPGKEADKVCAHCGKVVTEGAEIAATGHSWGEGEITKAPTCAEMGVRTYTCANCGETKTDDRVPATGEHTYGEWSVTREATTDAEGEETRTCSVCGNKETRSIEKLPEAENNTVLIVIIIVVVVLAGAGVATYFVLKNKKKAA